jgi:hypothetical protein
MSNMHLILMAQQALNVIRFNFYFLNIYRRFKYLFLLAGCCTCLSGLRMVGYCAHVIALVYFLSHARFLDYFESASHLKEYVVNIKENDSPSKVYTRRLKRKKNSEKLGFKCTETAEKKKL